MRNWDEAEEQGNQNCSVEADFQDARRICDQLAIPLHAVNFVRDYWTQVFSDFVAQVWPPVSQATHAVVSPPHLPALFISVLLSSYQGCMQALRHSICGVQCGRA